MKYFEYGNIICRFNEDIGFFEYYDRIEKSWRFACTWKYDKYAKVQMIPMLEEDAFLWMMER